MKQFTTPEQTAKLVELGFEKPKSIVYASAYQEEEGADPDVEYEYAYSVGELIEMLGYDLYNIHYFAFSWEVKSEKVEVKEEELIDALYNMIVKLKEEGVI